METLLAFQKNVNFRKFVLFYFLQQFCIKLLHNVVKNNKFAKFYSYENNSKLIITHKCTSLKQLDESRSANIIN